MLPLSLNISEAQLEPGKELLLAGRIPFLSQYETDDDDGFSLTVQIISDLDEVVLQVEIQPDRETIRITSQLNVSSSIEV